MISPGHATTGRPPTPAACRAWSAGTFSLSWRRPAATARRRHGGSASRARPSTANSRCGMGDRAAADAPLRGRSVRFRLLAIALLPMLVILPLLLGVAAYRWNARFDATLISKVNGDLTIA